MSAAPKTHERGSLRRLLPALAVTGASALMLAPAASASIVFDGSPGSGPAPATLGGYVMEASPQDSRANFELVMDAPATVDSSFSFDNPVDLRTIANGWLSAPWAGGTYSGRVYYSNGLNSVTMTLPVPFSAVSFYASPDLFGVVEMTATAHDGSSVSSGPVAVSNPFPKPGRVAGQYFGFYGTGGDKVQSVTITVPDPDGNGFGLALGNFALGDKVGNSAPPAPAAPLRFSLDGPPVRGESDTLGLDVLAPSPLEVTSVACPPKHAPTADVRQRERHRHAQTLVYNGFTDRYRYLWSPDKKIMRPGTCWSVQLTFDDGTKSPAVRFLVR